MRLWLALVAVALTGCVHLRSMPLGPGAPPLAGPVRFEHITAKDAEQRYTQVGLVCISYTGTDSPDAIEGKGEARQRLGDEACALGGNVVVPVGMCQVKSDERNTADGFQYGVYRDAGTAMARGH
jgi:hypothetical protein